MCPPVVELERACTLIYKTDTEEVFEPPWQQGISFDIKEHIGGMIGRQSCESDGFAVRTALGKKFMPCGSIRLLEPVSPRLTLEAGLGDESFERVSGEFGNRSPRCCAEGFHRRDPSTLKLLYLADGDSSNPHKVIRIIEEILRK